MKRRQLLFGLGAVGSAGAVGSGAFTSVQAQRDMTIQVADDADALLGLEPRDGPNAAAFTEVTDGMVGLDFSETDAGGSGLGTDSTYRFDDLLRVTNQGTQQVFVFVEFDLSESPFTRGEIYFYPRSNTARQLNDRANSVVTLPVGESVPLGLFVDTTDVTSDQSVTAIITATTENPATGPVVGRDGAIIAGPTDGLSHYYRLDDLSGGTAADAISDADGELRNSVTATEGQLEAAALLETNSDYLTVPDRESLDLTNTFTLVAWINTNVEQISFARVLSREQSGRGNRQYNLGFTRGGRRVRAVVDTTETESVEVTGNSDRTDGNWHHVVVTFDAAEAFRLYVDGSRVDQTSVTAPTVSRASDVVFGGIAHTPDQNLQYAGKLDDVRVYDRALSADEVSNLYNATR